MDTNVGLSLLTFRDLFEEPFYYPEKYSIFLSIIILEREQQTALKMYGLQKDCFSISLFLHPSVIIALKCPQPSLFYNGTKLLHSNNVLNAQTYVFKVSLKI